MPKNLSKSDLKIKQKEILDLIKKYNSLASKENLNFRLGLVKSEAFFEESIDMDPEDSEAKPKNLNKYFKENGPYGGPVVYEIQEPGAIGWFRSSICIGG